MRVKVKRCDICVSKLDKDEKCTWDGCPKCPNYEVKEQEKPKDKKDE